MKNRTKVVLLLALTLMSTSASAWWWWSAPTQSPARSEYTKTEYPIVLVHGLGGFSSLGGIIEYFHTIPYNLQRSGATVYVPSVSAFNSSEVRGQQLADYLARFDGTKVNLIGHSQGSPTARVAASLMPERVASITSVSGVNTGSELADVVKEFLPEGPNRDFVAYLFNTVGRLINYFSNTNYPQDSIAVLEDLSSTGSARLNDALGWAGVSRDCATMSEDVSVGGENIKMFSWGGSAIYTNWWDISDSILGITARYIPGTDDGLVTPCSQKLGNVISVSYDLNHLDSVNHAFGLRGRTDPVSLYRTHANRLKNKGL